MTEFGLTAVAVNSTHGGCTVDVMRVSKALRVHKRVHLPSPRVYAKGNGEL